MAERLRNLSAVKVLQVIDRLDTGGAERVFVDLVSLLHADGVAVEVLLIVGDGPLAEQLPKGVPVHRLERKHRWSLPAMFRFLRLARRFDLVHVHMRHNMKYVLVCLMAHLRRLPLVFHDHYGIDQVRPLWMRFIPGWIHYVGVSRDLTDWALGRLGGAASRVHLLPNTVLPPKDLTSRSPAASSLVMVANFRPVKNVEFAILLAKRLGLSLTLIGKADESPYGKKIKALIQEAVGIEWLADERNPAKHFQNCIAAVHPAKSESGPLVLLEYLAHGLPFLASDTGQVAAIAKQQLPELFLSTLDLEEWEDRLRQLLAHPPPPELLRGVFDRCFGPKTYLSQCLAIYRSILSGSRDA
jgi:glycosyltransferase involved in cell wall biosynthesis